MNKLFSSPGMMEIEHSTSQGHALNKNQSKSDEAMGLPFALTLMMHYSISIP